MDSANGDNGEVKDLFGGALTCFLPNDAVDVSQFRTIPDHQEVFCHKDTDQSIMIDILEFQNQNVAQGEQVPRYHFMDIAVSNDAYAENEVVSVEMLSKTHISFTQCDEAWFLQGRQMVAKFQEETMAKNLIDMYLALFRLPQHSTDIVVVMNDPIAISAQSSSSAVGNSTAESGSSRRWTVDTFKHIISTLKLLDPSLFDGE